MDQLEEGDYTPHGSIQLPIGLVTSFVGRYINCVYSCLQGSAYQGAVDLLFVFSASSRFILYLIHRLVVFWYTKIMVFSLVLV